MSGNGLGPEGNLILLGLGVVNILFGLLVGTILMIRVFIGSLGTGRGSGGPNLRRATLGRLFLSILSLSLLMMYGRGDTGGLIILCICLILAILAICAAAIIALKRRQALR